MLTGINVNIRHDGTTYHVQTEDGGLENPTITTLLFKAGAICSSKKTNYKELLQSDSLEETLKRLMETQHKEMIQELCGTETNQMPPPLAPSPSPSPISAQGKIMDQAQIEKKSTATAQEETREPLEPEPKALDELIQDYLANKQTGQDG